MEHYHVADLNEQQIQQIKGLEKELEVVLIAYDDSEKEENVQ